MNSERNAAGPMMHTSHLPGNSYNFMIAFCKREGIGIGEAGKQADLAPPDML